MDHNPKIPEGVKHPDRMLTIPEVLEITGLSRRQLRSQMDSRRIKYKRVGYRTLLVRRAWLDEWMSKNS